MRKTKIKASIIMLFAFFVAGLAAFAASTYDPNLFDPKPANQGFLGPVSGGNARPAFRAFVSDDIPSLPASKTTSGTFDAARIPNLDAAKITTGVLDEARVPTFNDLSPMITLGDVIGGGASGAATRIAGNTTTASKWLRSVGNGSVSALSSFEAIAAGDLPATAALTDAANSWSVSQTPSSANAIDLGSTALSWRNIYIGAATNNTKLVSAASGAQRTVTFPDGNSNTVIPDAGAANNWISAISSGGVITKSQPAFSNISGSLSAGQLPATAAKTDATNGFSVDQTPNAAGTIDIGTTALPWRNIYIGAAATQNTKLVSATITGGQKTVTFPNANSNTVVPDTGAANNFLTAISSAGVISKAQPSSSNLSDASNVALRNNGNSWSTAQLPSATGTIDLGSTTLAFRDLFLGGSSTNYHRLTYTTPTGARIHTLPNANSNTVIPDTGASNNFLTAISSGGVISKAQPAFSNISGVATNAQLPGGGGGAWTLATNATGFTASYGTWHLVTDTVTGTLPTAVGHGGEKIAMSLRTASDTLTVNTTSSQTIDGIASGALTTSTRYNGFIFVSDNANWMLE